VVADLEAPIPGLPRRAGHVVRVVRSPHRPEHVVVKALDPDLDAGDTGVDQSGRVSTVRPTIRCTAVSLTCSASSRFLDGNPFRPS
jgi:hypothetical protein